jgi:hypothetical protein
MGPTHKSAPTLGYSQTAPEAPPGSERGYYYVGDEWGILAHGEELFQDISAPAVSTFPGAHSIGQLNVANNGELKDTLELGWIRDYRSEEEHRLGSRIFLFVNPDKYKEGPKGKSCYNCDFTPFANAREDPLGQSFLPTDGTPNSACEAPPAGSKLYYQPCRETVTFVVEQNEGNWWIWFNGEWIGYVRNDAYGKTSPFKVTRAPSIYAEVYDQHYPASPTTDMGNGNYGSCTCATQMGNTFLLVPKPKTTELYWKLMVYHTPLNTEFTPAWYTAGNFGANRERYTYGGPGAG